MQVYVSNREIEQIAEGLVHVACGKPPPKRIDIDAVAVYLGLTVRYEKFAESDPDKIGFTSDGKSALTVFRNGKKQRILIRISCHFLSAAKVMICIALCKLSSTFFSFNRPLRVIYAS